MILFAYGDAAPSSATTAEYRDVSITAAEPCVTSTPGATRMKASTFPPSSSSAATDELRFPTRVANHENLAKHERIALTR